MKIIYWIVPAVLFVAACSTKSEDRIGFVESFSFDVPADTPPDSLTSAITKGFLSRYALIDTSMIASGKVIPANILAYDDASHETKCVQGYTIFVRDDPRARLDPNYPGDYFGSPSKVYFFTGTNNHFEVWNNPIVTQGSNEDTHEEASIILDHKASDECSLFGLKIST